MQILVGDYESARMFQTVTSQVTHNTLIIYVHIVYIAYRPQVGGGGGRKLEGTPSLYINDIFKMN